MKQISAAARRLEQASGLPAILDAACIAFEVMLPVIEHQQDRGGGTFAAFVMAGASAANGRHAVLAAPSLPWTAGAAPGEDDQPAAAVPAADVASALAGLSTVLARHLDDGAAIGAAAADKDACADAARHARDIAARLGGPSPR